MVTTFYPPYNFGGDGVFVRQLALDLVEAGHEVEVVHCVDAWRVVAGPGAPEPEPPATGSAAGAVPGTREERPGLVVHSLRSRLGALSPLWTQQLGRPGPKRRSLERILARGFDVVNFHNVSLVGGPGVLRLGGAAKLYTLHEHWWVCPTHVLLRYTGELCTRPSCLRCSLSWRTPPQLWRRARGWMARSLEAVDLVLAPSRFTADRHRAWMREAGCDVPLEVLPEYSPPLEEGAAAPAGLPRRYFLYVGRLSRVKGVAELVASFARRPDYPLVVAGTGELEAELRARATPNVRLLGAVPRAELGGLYAGAEALVFPSACAETFGLTACEALSAGTPVLARRCGGVEDLVDERVGALWDGEAELLEALDAAWNAPQRGAPLSRAARARWEERYTPERHRERYLAAVERARAHRRARALGR